MVRSVDPRRGTLRAIQWHIDAAILFGTLVAETILASGVTAAQTGRTHGRNRPDAKICTQTLAAEGPSTHGLLRLRLAMTRADEISPAVYLMANERNGTLYVGVTSNLVQRAWQHRTGALPGFSSRYGCVLLVWFEMHGTMVAAIAREKQIKGGSRARKLALIETANPQWRDLYFEII